MVKCEESPPLDYACIQKLPIIQRMVCMHAMNRRELGFLEAPDLEMEKMARLIFDSMEAPTRVFHNIDHIFDLCKGSDPIQVGAIAFHDIIYYQIDGGLSKLQREYLDDIIVEKDGVVSITKNKLEIAMELVMDIFGYSYGQVLNPYKGMNEFLSACIGTRVLINFDKDCLTKSMSVNAKRIACIEATIPFRGPDEKGRNPPEALYDRLVEVNKSYELGWDEDELVKAVQRAADLGNRDLENFSWTDRAAFLSNTWKLLAESNVALRRESYYLKDLSFAMKKMVGFFKFLDPETLYFSFRDPEAEVVVKQMTAEAKKNIDCAIIYLCLKYLALSVISAIAELSGGDAPISIFAGDLPCPGKPHTWSLEDFVDYNYKPKEGLKFQPEVMNVLREGRQLESKFDTKRSPLAAHLYAHIGDIGLGESLKYAVHPMDRENAILLLQHIPSEPAINIVSACAKIATTRKGIQKIVDYLRRNSTVDVQHGDIHDEI